MDENLLLKILELCDRKCLLTQLYEIAPKKEIHRAIHELIVEDELIELDEFDNTGIPQYRITALGSKALREQSFKRF